MREFFESIWEWLSWSDVGHWASAGEVVSAAAAVGGVLILLAGLKQIRDSRDRFRAEVAPYIRIDLSPHPGDGRLSGQNWFPAGPPDSDLAYEDINGKPRPLTPLSAWAGDLSIFLRVTNQQEGAAGVADDVEVTVEFEFPDGGSPAIRLGEEQAVYFSYLEPGHVNRYLLAAVDPSIPYLRGAVTSVRYRDMWGKKRQWWHGSGQFELCNGVLTNIRTVSHRGEG